jgi:hypothetical protein
MCFLWGTDWIFIYTWNSYQSHLNCFSKLYVDTKSGIQNPAPLSQATTYNHDNVFTFTLLLSEGRAGEAWEPSNRRYFPQVFKGIIRNTTIWFSVSSSLVPYVIFLPFLTSLPLSASPSSMLISSSLLSFFSLHKLATSIPLQLCVGRRHVSGRKRSRSFWTHSLCIFIEGSSEVNRTSARIGGSHIHTEMYVCGAISHSYPSHWLRIGDLNFICEPITVFSNAEGCYVQKITLKRYDKESCLLGYNAV